MNGKQLTSPRIGIVSFAHYHANFWSEAVNADVQASLAGVWDADAARGADAAKRFHTRYFDSMQDLLEACDAVGICSETRHHPAHIAAAATAGRHVLCEKPIAPNVESALRVRRLLRESAITYMQSFPKRFDPVSHRLRELVDSGRLGRISVARIRHGHYHGLDPEFCRQWYVDPKLSGGGALLDEGVHAADLLCWLFGLPDTVVAMVSNATASLEVEDTGVAVFGYPSGMIGEIASSCVYQAGEASIELYGELGTAIVSGVDLASRDITNAGYLKVFESTQPQRFWQLPDVVPQFKLGEFHHQNMWHFARCLREGREPDVGADDGIRALALIEAAYAAARTGRRQSIDIGQRLV